MLKTDEGLMLKRRGKNVAALLRRNGPRDFLIACGYFGRRQLHYHSPRVLLNRGRPLRVHGGLSIDVLPDDAGIGRELKAFGVHEPILSRQLVKEIVPGQNVIDIGANIGYFTLLLRQAVGSDGRVVAIEPSRENHELLRRNLAVNNFDDVQTLNAALSNEEGEATLHISSKSNWCTLLPRTDSAYVGTHSVQTLTLEGVAAYFGLTTVDAVRMDIEGYEFVALEGIRPALERFRPSLYIEVHGDIAPSRDSVPIFWKALDEVGYVVDWILPRCLDVNVPSHVSEVAKYGWDFGTSDLLDRFSFAEIQRSGALESEQFSVKLVPRERHAG
jgi:FkbM family methyltransferase